MGFFNVATEASNWAHYNTNNQIKTNCCEDVFTKNSKSKVNSNELVTDGKIMYDFIRTFNGFCNFQLWKVLGSNEPIQLENV